MQLYDSRVSIKKVIWIVYFEGKEKMFEQWPPVLYYIRYNILYTFMGFVRKKRVIRGKCLFYVLYLRRLMLFSAFPFLFEKIVLYTFHPKYGHLIFLYLILNFIRNWVICGGLLTLSQPSPKMLDLIMYRYFFVKQQ